MNAALTRYRVMANVVGVVLLAGTVPFLSFVVERRITREVRERVAQ